MSIQDERIETAFNDELLRMKHEGVGKLMEMRLDVLLWQVYRRGYIRGHSARSREVQQDEEQAIREGRLPMNVKVSYQGDKLLIEGKDRTPARDRATAWPPLPSAEEPEP
jgi:hypothetical protein